jgi:hypothetical protein
MRLRSAAVAVACVLSAMYAVPAAANESTSADLSLSVTGESVVRLAGKPFLVHLHNNGPGTATGVKVTIDASGLDGSKVAFDLPHGAQPDGSTCDRSGKSTVCELADIPNGGNNAPFAAIIIASIFAKGDAGSFTVTVSSDSDPDQDNNKKVTQSISVVPASFDLVAVAFDVYAAPGTKAAVQPGHTAELNWFLQNFGSRAAHGVEFTITLPDFVTFAEKRANCTYNSDNNVATCGRPNRVLRPGQVLMPAKPFLVMLAADAPGPQALVGGKVTGAGISDGEGTVEPLDAGWLSTVADDTKVADASTFSRSRKNDADASDNTAEFTVFAAENPADLAITATAGSGKVGDTVNLDFSVRDNGPADSPHTTGTLTAPTGTEIVTVPDHCSMTTPGRVVECQGPLNAGDEPLVFTVGFKITSTTVGTDGTAEIKGSAPDNDLSNNKAPVTITVLSDVSLPTTGAKVGLIAGGGALVVLVGGILLLLARRRRVVLVVPED